jgi:hypothetical protein
MQNLCVDDQEIQQEEPLQDQNSPKSQYQKSSIKDNINIYIYDWNHVYLKNHPTSEKDPKTSIHS